MVNVVRSEAIEGEVTVSDREWSIVRASPDPGSEIGDRYVSAPGLRGVIEPFGLREGSGVFQASRA